MQIQRLFQPGRAADISVCLLPSLNGFFHSLTTCHSKTSAMKLFDDKVLHFIVGQAILYAMQVHKSQPLAVNSHVSSEFFQALNVL